ncbi:MAG: hypothetical protein DYH06_10680, partial [Acidobacteria bacterium ACB2]|nr:hypothetical protein [Acidobacteria bacterium ACB2]
DGARADRTAQDQVEVAHRPVEKQVPDRPANEVDRVDGGRERRPHGLEDALERRPALRFVTAAAHEEG